MMHVVEFVNGKNFSNSVYILIIQIEVVFIYYLEYILYLLANLNRGVKHKAHKMIII